MKLRGYNQTTLANASGGRLGQNYISQLIKKGNQMPRDDKIEAFTELLGLSKADFYAADGRLPEPAHDDSERGVILGLMMAHPQAGPMLLRLKAEASVEDYPALLDEALEHFAVGLGRTLRRRREIGQEEGQDGGTGRS